MTAKQKWVYLSDWNVEVDLAAHRVSSRVMRRYALRSIRMTDGPDTKRITTGSIRKDGVAQGVWFPVPKWTGDSGSRYCDSAKQAHSHVIPAADVQKFCLEELGMAMPEPDVVYVDKIVEVEVPLALSFEERDIMANALRREQHVTNEMLRRAYEADDVPRAGLLLGRLKETVSLMGRLGINPDAWANGPVWLVDTEFDTQEQPGFVVDEPQLHMFAKESA